VTGRSVASREVLSVTFVLFFVLAFGMLGFVAKSIIAKLLGL
jgi:hypothetical protein